MTTSLAGSEVGLGLMWAALAGVVFKFALTEGIARWWLATQSTPLEGWAWRLGGWIRWAFFAYLLLFTLVVGGALVTACGVAGGGAGSPGRPRDLKDRLGDLPFTVGLGIGPVRELRAV